MTQNETNATTISEFFQKDHREIDNLLVVLKRELKIAAESQHPAVHGLVLQFQEFDGRLDRHIRWEEEILFPAVEEKQPQLRHGPGEVMRMEHTEIRDLKKAALNYLNDEDTSKALTALENAMDVLGSHNQKEENIYYPMADQLLDAQTIAQVLNKVRADT